MSKGESELTRRLVLIHTVPPLIGTFARLVPKILPDAKLFHMLDEPLLERVRQHRTMTEDDIAALQAHVSLAEDIGADAVLVTCSTLSPGLDRVSAKIPIIKIDEAMITQAVQQGIRIGVLATSQSTLKPTRSMLDDEAERQGKSIEVTPVMIQNALDALLRGDDATHDQLVRAAIADLEPQVDVIVLAQASMARVLDGLPEQPGQAPLLSSPHAALAQLKNALERQP